MSSGNIIGSHRLDNGLELNFVDRSKQIATDRWYVSVTVQVEIPVEKKWFDRQIFSDIDFEGIRRELGDVVRFEQKKDRNFISASQKDRLIEDICEMTLKTTKRYLESENFPAKFILKQYSEKQRKF